MALMTFTANVVQLLKVGQDYMYFRLEILSTMQTLYTFMQLYIIH